MHVSVLRSRFITTTNQWILLYLEFVEKKTELSIQCASERRVVLMWIYKQFETRYKISYALSYSTDRNIIVIVREIIH